MGLMQDAIPAWSVVLVVPQGKNVLALSRSFNVRDPALPGGDSEEADETPAATAVRVLLEETGLRAVELKCIDQRVGERGQPVFAYFIPRWRGSRLRVSDAGKPFWTHPSALTVKTAQFREIAQQLFDKLSELVVAA
jgi:8-oxo-dGTP pyrophosphatase MutT (NUDIX family)